jgi:peroxiredoxin Q/BCP
LKKIIILALPLLMALVPGEKAPDFQAKNQHGKTIKLSDYKNKFVLIYFYPKDDTPGCTVQAQGLRDKYDEFKKANAVILGVSRQDEKSHKEFIAKYNLPFDLLVDSDGSLAKSLGVGSMPVLSLSKRQSVLVNPAGKVVRFYEDVDPKKHADDVLGDIKNNLKK